MKIPLSLFQPEVREELAQQLVDGPGVLIVPSSVFDFAGNFFRLGFSRTTMSQSLERFKEFVDTNRKSW